MWNDDCLAYLTLRQVPQTTQERYELGVIAHGPGRERLAADLADVVVRFDREGRSVGQPVVRAYRRDARDVPDGVTIDKPSVRLLIT
ncbi:MAG: hypothetical protein JO362_08895 [Streptomycetaceae bacterium]|nr:hypothetical protein [Streptomycetaceae bacterium]